MSTAPTTEPTAPTPPPNGIDWAGPQRSVAICAIVGLAIYAVTGGIMLGAAEGEHVHAAKTQFFLSWLVGFVFWVSLPLGSMALLMIHYLAKTSWGLLMKKPFEAATRTWPLFFVLFLPILAVAAMKDVTPYWWGNPEERTISEEMRKAHEKYVAFEKAEKEFADVRGDTSLAKDPRTIKPTPTEFSLEMQRRAIEEEQKGRQQGTFGFITPAGFIVGTLVYFAIWAGFIFLLNKCGKAADDNPAQVEPSLEKAKNWSGPGLIVYAIVGTAAATQWVMSLEPSWASTMFPVIYSVNQMLTTFAFGVAVVVTLTLSGKTQHAQVMRTKFRIDMGSLMLALTLFWSYTSFSQYMLIWIGNLPEEIPFFLRRSNPTFGGWWWVSAFLVVFHFAVPFVVLLFRDVKNNPIRLRAMAIYVIVVCAVDVLWWIEPALPHQGLALFWLMDIGAILGIGGLFGLFFIYQLRRRPLFPVNETYLLPEGHDHTGSSHGTPPGEVAHGH